ncbi:MFS transporter [Lacticaseibacillus saniviri]|uniref:Permease of the major facilitator superfamily protein n=1 Tax=Lacticaseibacillus saniviri JCM 17471 = DSM 24301 TaxID=1293598 RepID=A0A0R2N1F2_9LACO|nr:MFS transporter [Lacticaseibacillus saniviri]KRO17837.1 permease of the major facilitator superfamily protein [Lacticaseibacillus saniviri JCM 17471 = DSM 24301]MCG4282082.1 MFS transporter [Lacticaseibacillus saniviri]
MQSAWRGNAARYLISQNLFVFGSSTVTFAILWYLALKTASGAWMTYASLAGTLPAILISLFAGVWADRCSRKWLVIGASAIVTVLTLVLAVVFLTVDHSLWVLLAISAVRSFGNGVEMPAANALLPEIVPKEQLTRMNGLNQIVMSLMLLMSPLLAGWILGDAGIFWIFIVDATTALLAILALLRLDPPKRKRAPVTDSNWQELKSGLTAVVHNHTLAVFMAFVALAYILITPSSQLSTLYVKRTFGSGVWALTFNELAWTVGASLGGLYIVMNKQLKAPLNTMVIGFFGSGIAFFAMGLVEPFWIYLFFMFVSGIFYPIMQAAQTIYLQETVSPELMGRTFSLWQILSTGIYPIAMLGYGPLADVIPIGPIFVVTGLALAVAATIFYWQHRRSATNAD